MATMADQIHLKDQPPTKMVGEKAEIHDAATPHSDASSVQAGVQKAMILKRLGPVQR